MKKTALSWAGLLVPFGLSLLLSLWLQLRVYEYKIDLLLDSGHYLLTAADISALWPALLSGRAGEWLANRAYSADIMIDGPVLSGLAAFFFLLTKQDPVGRSWILAVLITSLSNALAALSTTWLARRLCGGAPALLAGLLWACYPAALVASGRFLTEPLAVCILLLLVAAGAWAGEGQLAAGADGAQNSANSGAKSLLAGGFLAGLLAALGFLLKPVLAPLWGLFIVLVPLAGDKKVGRFLPFLLSSMVGALLVMGSWLAYTRASTGQFYLTPQRVPTYNLAKGHDLEADGWSTNPDWPRTLLNDSCASGTAIVGAAWREQPLAMASLYLRKIPRVMGFEWNDFRQPVFGLTVDMQNYWHGFLLACGIFGAAALLRQRPSAGVGRYVGACCLTALVVHALLYLPFEAISRYGYCAVPFAIIAGTYGFSIVPLKRLAVSIVVLLAAAVLVKASFLESLFPSLTELALVTTIWRSVVVLGAFFFLLHYSLAVSLKVDRRPLLLVGSLFFLLVFLPLLTVSSYLSEYRTVAVDLKPGEHLERHLLLPARSGETFLLMVDCDDRGGAAKFKVNGQVLAGPLISLNKMDSSYYSLYNLMRMYSAAIDKPVEGLRQWRALVVPASLLKAGAENVLAVQAGSPGLTLYFDRLVAGEERLHLLDRGFSGGMYCNGGSQADGRLPDPVSIKIPRGETVLVKAGAPTAVKQQMPRLYLLAWPGLAGAGGGDDITLAVKLKPTDFDSALWQGRTDDALRLDRYTFQMARSTICEKELPYDRSHPHVWVTLSGQIRAVGRVRKAGVYLLAASKRSGGPFLPLPAASPFVTAADNWSEFQISDLINLEMLQGEAGKICVGLYPGRWEQFTQYGVDRTVGSFLFRNLQLTVRRAPEPIISGRRPIYL